MKPSSCRVCPLLLAIAYLEVVIWITVLCTSAATLSHNAEDTAYVVRETENLKHSLTAQGVFDTGLEAADFDAHHSNQLDQHTLLKVQDSASLPARTLRTNQFLNFVLSFTGIPAPYAGVKAIF